MDSPISPSNPIFQEGDWLRRGRDEGARMVVYKVRAEGRERTVVPGLLRFEPLSQLVTEDPGSVVPTTRVRCVCTFEVDFRALGEQDHWPGVLLITMLDSTSFKNVQDSGRTLSIDGSGIGQGVSDDQPFSGNPLAIKWVTDNSFDDPLATGTGLPEPPTSES